MPTRLDDAYVAQVKAIKARVQLFAKTRFAAGQYRDADLERFLAVVVPVALAGRTQVAALTDSYLSQVIAGAGVKLPPRKKIDTASLRGVDVSEVYSRPFVTVRTKLSEGKTLDVAISAGAARLQDIVATDLQLAKTHTARNIFGSSDRIRAFERTLSGPSSCALCVIASTQRYLKEDLLPIHPGCDCGVDPILDTGEHVIHGDRLEATHAQVESAIGDSDRQGRDVGLSNANAKGEPLPDYAKVLVTHEHGEIGPVLSIRGQHFDGPTSIE